MNTELLTSIARAIATKKLLEPVQGASADAGAATSASATAGTSVRDTIPAGPASIYSRSLAHPQTASPALLAAVRLEAAGAGSPAWKDRKSVV